MSLPLDIRTILFLSALLTSLIGIVLLTIRRFFPASLRTSWGWWTAGMFLHPVAFVLLGLQGLIADPLSIIVGNTLTAASLACLCQALCVFNGVPRRVVCLALLVGAVALVELWFNFIQPNQAIGIGLEAMLYSIFLVYGLYGLYRSETKATASTHVVGFILAAGVAILGARSAYFLLAGNALTPAFNVSILQLLSGGFASMLPMISTLGFLLLCTERTHRQLELAAHIDYLTGAYNRRAMEELGTRAVATAQRHARPLAVIAVDIDRFKRINDQFGHAVGDIALIQSVQRIRQNLRDEDLIGRQGGEEFLVLMPETDIERASLVAERIRLAFSEHPLILNGAPREVTVSLGVAALGTTDDRYGRLQQRADRAMYEAKQTGRNRVIVDRDLPLPSASERIPV